MGLPKLTTNLLVDGMLNWIFSYKFKTTNMENLTKESIAKMIDFHIACVKRAERKGFAIDHCKVVAWLEENPKCSYIQYSMKCASFGIYQSKNFDEEALRESLQAGATQFMDPSVTDPLAGE